jgi:hypothetical protein
MRPGLLSHAFGCLAIGRQNADAFGRETDVFERFDGFPSVISLVEHTNNSGALKCRCHGFLVGLGVRPKVVSDNVAAAELRSTDCTMLIRVAQAQHAPRVRSHQAHG